jgi:CheY-like chemotaxis protein
LQAKSVDLMFLDVQMPEIGGFEIVERLGVQQLPPTVLLPPTTSMRSGRSIFMPWTT